MKKLIALGFLVAIAALQEAQADGGANYDFPVDVSQTLSKSLDALGLTTLQIYTRCTQPLQGGPSTCTITLIMPDIDQQIEKLIAVGLSPEIYPNAQDSTNLWDALTVPTIQEQPISFENFPGDLSRSEGGKFVCASSTECTVSWSANGGF